MLPGLQFTTTMSCKHTLKATHIRQQEQNLGALINKRQVTYNMVVESGILVKAKCMQPYLQLMLEEEKQF